MVEIENAELLTSYFGHWPDFHDAELLAIRLETTMQERKASLEADIEVAEYSPEVDEKGYYKDRRRCHTTLRFERVLDVALDGFAYQNVLDDIEIREITPEEQASDPEWWKRRYQMRFAPIAGFCEVLFRCDSIAVLSAVPVARTP